MKSTRTSKTLAALLGIVALALAVAPIAMGSNVVRPAKASVVAATPPPSHDDIQPCK